MFSAETLSWILGARRFNSIARICDSRTPVTVTSCSSSASDPALAVLDLGLVASGDGVAGPPCCAGSCTPEFSAGALVSSDAMAEVVAAASNAMDIAIDRGCLRYTFDTAFPSRLLSFGSQMPYGACSADPHLSIPMTNRRAVSSVYLFGRLTNQSRMLRDFRQV